MLTDHSHFSNSQNNYKILQSPQQPLHKNDKYIPQPSSYQYHNQQIQGISEFNNKQQREYINGVIKWQCIAMMVQCVINALLYIFVIRYEGFFPALLLILGFQFIICIFFLYRVIKFKASNKSVKYFKVYKIFLLILYLIVLVSFVIGLIVEFIFYDSERNEDWLYFCQVIGFVIGFIFMKFVVNYLIKNKFEDN